MIRLVDEQDRVIRCGRKQGRWCYKWCHMRAENQAHLKEPTARRLPQIQLICVWGCRLFLPRPPVRPSNPRVSAPSSCPGLSAIGSGASG